MSASTFPRLLPNPADGAAIRLRVLSLGAGVHVRCVTARGATLESRIVVFPGLCLSGLGNAMRGRGLRRTS